MGYIATSITGVAAAGAMANIVMGISKFIWAGLVVVWKLSLATLKLIPGAVWLANKAMVIWQATLKLLRGTLLALRMAAITAGIGFNLMSLPIILIIGAIALLGVGIYYLIKHWDVVKAAIQDTTAFKVLAAVVMMVGQVFSDVWEWIAEGWESLCNWFGEFSLTETFEAVANSIRNIFGNVWAWVKETFADIYNSFVDTLNYLPGVEIERMEINTPAAQATNSVPDVESMAAVDIIRQQQLFMQAQVEQAEPITNTQILTGKQLKGIDKMALGKCRGFNNQSCR